MYEYLVSSKFEMLCMVLLHMLCKNKFWPMFVWKLLLIWYPKKSCFWQQVALWGFPILAKNAQKKKQLKLKHFFKRIAWTTECFVKQKFYDLSLNLYYYMYLHNQSNGKVIELVVTKSLGKETLEMVIKEIDNLFCIGLNAFSFCYTLVLLGIVNLSLSFMLLMTLCKHF